MTRLVLLASPLVGPAVWTPVADELRRRGRTVTVPPLRTPPRTSIGPSPETSTGPPPETSIGPSRETAIGPSPEPSPGTSSELFRGPSRGPSRATRIATPRDVLDAFLAGIPDEPGLTLVAHSNAGLYVAALAAERDASAVVFVDAGLPSDEPATPTAPPAFRARLAALAGEDGLLPPWTKWWPDEDVDALFPDRAGRTAVEREQPRLPLSYFDDEVPSPGGWQRLPAAYLAFGDTYADERAEARRRGWPTETMPGEHLHLLVDPVGVATALERLLDRATARRSAGGGPTGG